MFRRKKTKAAALLAGAVIIVLSIAMPASTYGLHAGCSLAERMTYPFLHANILHAGLNVYVLLSAVFLYDVSPRQLILSYLIAVSFPVTQLSTLNSPLGSAAWLGQELSTQITVGLSGINYALMALIIPQVAQPRPYILTVLAYILVGFAFPNCNNVLHLYCFLLALPLSMLRRHRNNTPPP